jgi:hypothetical protein
MVSLLLQVNDECPKCHNPQLEYYTRQVSVQLMNMNSYEHEQEQEQEQEHET